MEFLIQAGLIEGMFLIGCGVGYYFRGRGVSGVEQDVADVKAKIETLITKVESIGKPSPAPVAA